jgi:hypothetical protein
LFSFHLCDVVVAAVLRKQVRVLRQCSHSGIDINL